MKKLLLIAISFFVINTTFAQTAQNISFTDLDGVTHDLYSYLDSGYTVILDFSYQYCGPCHDWSVNVGHNLWESYGPEGDNSLRMFFFDVSLSILESDANVAAYTQDWGIECPVINLDGYNTIPEYPEDGYPTIYVICPNRSIYQDGGYGVYSMLEVSTRLSACQGADIDGDVAILSASSADFLCDSRINYAPEIHVCQTDVFGGMGLIQGGMDQDFNVEVIINQSVLDTFLVEYINLGDSVDFIVINGDTVETSNDPPFEIETVLPEFEVNLGDEITLVLHYPGDNFNGNDSITVSIPLELNTPSSIDTMFSIEASSEHLSYKIYNPDGELILYNSESSTFNLSPGSCYSIEFINPHLSDVTFKDLSEIEMLSFEAGEVQMQMPRFYFNVGNSTSIFTHHQTKVTETYYLNLLGKKVSNSLSELPKGIYIEIKHYNTGNFEQRKLFKIE